MRCQTCPDFQPNQLHRFNPPAWFVCVAIGWKERIPPRPKPQNLGGLVGGEAEFDPLGFSDTFDVRALESAGGEHGVLQGQNQGFFVGFCFEGTTIEDQSVKAFCCTNWCFCYYLEFSRIFKHYSDGFIHPPSTVTLFSFLLKADKQLSERSLCQSPNFWAKWFSS